MEPNREQAYGSEASIGDGLATMGTDATDQMVPAADDGWNENFPMTLVSWAYEEVHRHLAAQTTPGQIAATCWEGGQPISSFRNGTSNFANLEVYLSGWSDMVARHGRTTDAPVIHWTQGEGGGATYQADCEALFAEIDVAVSAAGFGTPGKVALQVNQTDTSQSNPESRQAIVNIARNGGCVLAGPMYVAKLYDNIHSGQHGDVVLAGISALAEYRLRNGLDVDPLWITGVVPSGSTAVITYHLPTHCTAIEIDTTNTPAVPDAGFVCSDASGALAITDVSVTGAAEITLTFDRAVSGALTVNYAISTMDNAADGWANGMGNVMCVSSVPSLFAGETFSGRVVPDFILQPAVAETFSS